MTARAVDLPARPRPRTPAVATAPAQLVRRGHGHAGRQAVTALLAGGAPDPRVLARPGPALLQVQRQYGNRRAQRVVGAARPLPTALRSAVERLAGVGMDGVRVHRDSALPARLGAAAFTRGTDIFLGPGQDRHLAHEAWHVAQQHQGRVRRRLDVDGTPVDDSPALEREADTMSRRIGTTRPGSERPIPHTPDRPGGEPVVQRVVSIGTELLPPSDELPADFMKYLQTNRLLQHFRQLNDERERVHIFSSNQHLDAYLKKLADPKLGAVHKPLVGTLSAEQLQQAHRYRQDLRFAHVMEPSPNQIPQHGHGAHAIELPMLPPAGTGQQWGTFTLASGAQQLSMFANRFQPPPSYTDLLTFGDPSTPSLITNQSDLTLGMYNQPLPKKSPFIAPIARKDTRYAGIPEAPGKGRVRGHPNKLTQNARSTRRGGREMDAERRAYTDESDSTKSANQGPPMGGVSSWRENEIETPAENSQQPFTQINVNPVRGPLGIARPDHLHFRRRAGQGYEDIRIDNRHRRNYKKEWNKAGGRTGTGKRQYAYQTELGRQDAQQNPFPETPVRRQGEDFDDPGTSTYPGYASPPRSPYVALSGGETFLESVPGRRRVGDRVMSDRRKVACVVVEVSGYGNGHTACTLEEVAGAATFDDTLPGRLLAGQEVTASDGTHCLVIGVHSYDDTADETTCTLREIPRRQSRWRWGPY